MYFEGNGLWNLNLTLMLKGNATVIYSTDTDFTHRCSLATPVNLLIIMAKCLCGDTVSCQRYCGISDPVLYCISLYFCWAMNMRILKMKPSVRSFRLRCVKRSKCIEIGLLDSNATWTCWPALRRHIVFIPRPEDGYMFLWNVGIYMKSARR
jgi:hypothetical protein